MRLSFSCFFTDYNSLFLYLRIIINLTNNSSYSFMLSHMDLFWTSIHILSLYLAKNYIWTFVGSITIKGMRLICIITYMHKFELPPFIYFCHPSNLLKFLLFKSKLNFYCANLKYFDFLIFLKSILNVFKLIIQL